MVKHGVAHAVSEYIVSVAEPEQLTDVGAQVHEEHCAALGGSRVWCASTARTGKLLGHVGAFGVAPS
jgi:hypothetical protein